MISSGIILPFIYIYIVGMIVESNSSLGINHPHNPIAAWWIPTHPIWEDHWESLQTHQYNGIDWTFLSKPTSSSWNEGFWPRHGMVTSSTMGTMRGTLLPWESRAFGVSPGGSHWLISSSSPTKTAEKNGGFFLSPMSRHVQRDVSGLWSFSEWRFVGIQKSGENLPVLPFKRSENSRNVAKKKQMVWYLFSIMIICKKGIPNKNWMVFFPNQDHFLCSWGSWGHLPDLVTWYILVSCDGKICHQYHVFKILQTQTGETGNGWKWRIERWGKISHPCVSMLHFHPCPVSYLPSLVSTPIHVFFQDTWTTCLHWQNVHRKNMNVSMCQWQEITQKLSALLKKKKNV